MPMKRCTTIAELEEELQIQNAQMSDVVAALTAAVGDNSIATRESVLANRQRFVEIRSEQVLRTYQLEESRPYGVVTAGSLDRALQRIQREIPG
jgi:hypothetical protein